MATSILTYPVNPLADEAQFSSLREVCALGHPLGDCPARRAGCGNHYLLLHFMLPPWPVRDYVQAMMGNDPEVREWLDRLNSVLPGDEETRENWR